MSIRKSIVVLAVPVFAVAAFAQEEEAAEQPKQEQSAVKASANFSTLPFCRLVEPPVEVRKPKGEWVPAEEGKFYPLGTSYRALKGGKLVLSFGANSTATIEGEASFGTRAQPVGCASRTIVLDSGKVSLQLADNLPDGAFFVVAPGFEAFNAAGESNFNYERTADGDKAVVRCVTGSLAVKGRHFDIPQMRAADEVVIVTSHDHLITILEGTSGDYSVKVDQGVRAATEIDDAGAVKEVVAKELLDWHLSPKTRVVINRAVPAVGERMSVHTMAFDASGEKRSDRVFCEGRAEINSGELVVKPISSDEIAERAAEAAETTEESAEESSSGDAESSESSEESESTEE